MYFSSVLMFIHLNWRKHFNRQSSVTIIFTELIVFSAFIAADLKKYKTGKTKLMKHKIIFRLIFFILAIGCQIQLFGTQVIKVPDFVKETENEFIFTNKNSKLVFHKNEYTLHLYGKEGELQYAGEVPPSFLVDNQWVSLSSVNRIIYNDKEKVRLEATLSNGDNAFLEISSTGDFGFHVVIKCNNPKTSEIKGTTVLNPVEEIYGFGEMWNGHVAQRGQSFDLWDKGGTPDECAYMPYYVSTNNYAFYLNYGGKVSFDVGQTNATELVFWASTPVFEFTLLSGNSVAGAVQNFQKINGMPSVPPRWAFKPWFWLMGDPDKPGANITSLKGEHFPKMIKKLKELNIPVGVTWLEPPWQNARTSFIPNKEFSTDLKSLIKEINDLGVKTLAWTVPYTTNAASNWTEALEKGYLVRKPSGKETNKEFSITASGELEGNFYTAIDFFNPDAAAWWQKQIEKSLELGLRGYKLDAGQDLPADALLYGGRIGKDVHNSYALEYNKVYYNALKNKLDDDFLMIPRAVWIGSQAYTNFKWPGDLAADFGSNGLSSSVYSSLSLALSGMPFVSTDIGGFENRPPSEKVWLRWAQFGAFIPGMQTLQMPWWYSDEAISHFRYLTWLHTDLIPFWTSLSHEANVSGTPIIRPLIWDYQNDVKSWRIDDQFTVGNAIMVAPIMNSNEEREVYLPEGRWYDFWDENQTIQGPVKINWHKYQKNATYKFPVYIREGAIIPMEISNNITGFGSASSKGYITLAMWPKTIGESDFVLNDTEEPINIKAGFSNKNKFSISWDKTNQDYIFRIHFHLGRVPSSVLSKSKTTLENFSSLKSFRATKTEGWYFDAEKNNLWIRKMNKNEKGEIIINWPKI